MELKKKDSVFQSVVCIVHIWQGIDTEIDLF